MDIFIVRHGDAPGQPDGSERQLSTQGRIEALGAAEYILRAVGHDLTQLPRVWLTSPKLRAQQTAQCIDDAIQADLQWQDEALLARSGNPQMVAEALLLHDPASVVAVSHMPIVTEVLEYLCGERIFFATAGMAHVRIGSGGSRGKLINYYQPKP